MEKRIHIYQNKKELIAATTEKMVCFIERAIRESGLCNLALAGGNTPRDVYSMLTANPYRNRVDWNCVHIFWGDERMVPPEHHDSNFKMIQETLLGHIEMPDANVHRIHGESTPEQAAAGYAELLRKHFGESLPSFDLLLLGIGDDGHTASLFPGTDALVEDHQTVVAVFVPKINSWRVTLTLPVINASKEIIFLVSGSSKSDIVRQITSIERPTKDIPATMVDPEKGIIHWMLDYEAADLIKRSVREGLSKK